MCTLRSSQVHLLRRAQAATRELQKLQNEHKKMAAELERVKASNEVSGLRHSRVFIVLIDMWWVSLTSGWIDEIQPKAHILAILLHNKAAGRGGQGCGSRRIQGGPDTQEQDQGRRPTLLARRAES